MDAWYILWAERAQLLSGFATTLALFVGAAVGAFILAALLLPLLEGRITPARRLLRSLIDGVRLLPFLVLLYLLYYGLPLLGVRLDAWVAGYVALILYHGLYITEILRGARTVLPKGQADAARAHGYATGGLYRRILLPQLVLGSAPMLGNQLVICLKDTAFLTFITVIELTGAATAIQSTHFIPIQAFVVAVGFYWLISLAIEALTRALGRCAAKRGLAS
ncbi:ABC transporter permease subunit [Phytopseudomonas dryadis]|uniref:ABC transporter permease n=1 Tax=Phytopseudomonas dryadis TaxID=2487520 RepID=A0ABY1Z3B2_9GAMM|nr:MULTISPECIES: ABC transporter permease subunit [Pseudomonas]TBV03232.1 ABC transporter permease [Pseudomonas dryadis]TBV16394.1 ABC transporter permease [Pseudomonas sp. FRB 230]